MIVNSLAGWRDQYARMQRSFEKVRKTAHRSSIDYDDDVLHFFMDCWHLKDWIKSDAKVDPQVKGAIDQEIDRHLSLRIARTLANGWKHLKPDRQKSGAQVTTKRIAASVATKSVTVGLGGSGELVVTHEVRLDDGTVTTAQEIAVEACVAWDAVLNKLGLDPKPPA